MNDVTDLGPLSWNVPIVNNRGNPTPEFTLRWEKQRNNNKAISKITSKSVINNFTTTSDFQVYFLDTSGGSYTVTLNAKPAVNEIVEVWDSTGHAGSHPVSFNGNGQKIAGDSLVSNFISINYGHARLIYNGTQWLMQ